MKKLFALVLTLLLSVTLCACPAEFLGDIDLGGLMNPVEGAFQTHSRNHLRAIRLLVEPHNRLSSATTLVGYDILPLHEIRNAVLSPLLHVRLELLDLEWTVRH